MTLFNGLLDLSWWQLVLITLALTHVTIAAVTIFLHRAQAHRALDLHPAVSHFFRLWLWLTTGMVTAEWVAIHRRHHARCETPEDPHSPQVLGLRKVLWEGAELYQKAATDKALIERYSHGTPDDWLERNVYGRLRWQGPAVMLITDFVLFGAAGVAIWAVQMVWIPFWAAGVINGIGHYWGYRNFESPDAAANISPWGILIGGEELHNNHHAFPSSARLSNRWWEFDIGWLYIRTLEILRLAKVRRVAPRPHLAEGKTMVDLDTLKAVITNRMHVAARYARDVIRPVSRKELCGEDAACRRVYRQARRLLVRDESHLDETSRQRLARLLEKSPTLATVVEYRKKLQDVWERTTASQEALLQSLQDWCRQAEASGIRSLAEFAHTLRSYTLQTR
jgi:stearoyl-CoA desaturase (delta-9 desaturase)